MASEPTLETIEPLVKRYLERYPNEAAGLLETASPREIAPLLEAERPAVAVRVLEALSPEVAADTLPHLSDGLLGQLFPAFELRRLASLIARLDHAERERMLELAGKGRARDLRNLSSYREGTAGHIMDPRFASFRPDLRAGSVIERLHKVRRRKVRDLPVVDEHGLLLGMLPLHEALLAEPDRTLRELVSSPSAAVSANASRDDVLNALNGSGLTTLPVIDFEGRLIGVIHNDALVQAARDEASADMLMMVGAGKEERALAKPWYSVSKRLPWLHINLLTAFLAASVVGLFEETIARFTALAVLLPVVAGQSGNTGAQAQAVTMRGLALKEIGVSLWPRILWKELRVGVVNGAAIALVTMLGVFVWSQNFGLTLVIGIAMILSMAIASVSGMAVPIVLTALKQDPAQSSSIILTTITDILGFLSFLGLATLLAGLLGAS